ncbi:MAG: pectate lyase [Spongiibacteraceae bacterium]|nr:pectate lyase [Spongiibacteraceae bacterium]
MRTHSFRIIPFFCCCVFLFNNLCIAAPTEKNVRDTMKRATVFMTHTVSYDGGYVWSYLPDFSRRWGEMEAKPTMVWVQPPGTATMGHLYLDTYHASQDDFYYQAAQQVGDVLIRGQHASGGWNYMFDLAGEKSLQQWYQTIGRNGWALEEFHHYYGNATFDDAGTFEASVFLLRLYLEKHDKQYRPALNRAINFVLDSQYPIGGWPQRFPPMKEHANKGQADYSRYITFNDGVAAKNLFFLLFCYQSLNEAPLRKRLLNAIDRGMDAFIQLKLPAPQPGWALQYSLDRKPAAARSYEPISVSVGTTANNLNLLMRFYELSGDNKFLETIPQSLDWLESLQLPQALIRDGRTHPRMVEIGTDRPLFVHRRGSNVNNGHYFINYDSAFQVSHYPSTGRVDVQALRKKYQVLKTAAAQTASNKTDLTLKNIPELPLFFIHSWYVSRDAQTGKTTQKTKPSNKQINSIIKTLNAQGYWPSELRSVTHPYNAKGKVSNTQSDYRTSRVGDDSDTAPYTPDPPLTGITLLSYIKNMSVLLQYLEQVDE